MPPLAWLLPILVAAAPAPPDPSADASVALAIPARAQAAGAPKEGWCGETAIQEALLHAGVWAPQRLINAAGKPVHPDLYANEVPVALAALGVRYTFYVPREHSYEALARWIRAGIEAGDPVLAGVKILPTQHPQWGLDHFVLAVGYGARGILVNTTWGSRAWVADTSGPGLSLKGGSYAIRVHAPARAAELTVLEEDDRTVKLQVTCSGLAVGARYRLERRAHDAKAPEWTEAFTATAARAATRVAIGAEAVARFRCAPER